ncbi:MAG: glycosyltransferase family 39 protein [Planctomycetes bacterium]|nr:glycosyltransferase family 39 protein [Planctomycetota bacterium]
MSTWVRLTTLILIFAGALFLRARDLSNPFDLSPAGDRDASYAIAARHLAREGFAGAGCFPTFDAELDEHAVADLDDPPLVHWLNAGTLRLFGIDPWVLRLHHMLASLAVCLLTYVLGTRAMGPLGALVATAITACLPALALSGTHVDRTNLGLALTLLATWSHVRWNELGRLRDALRFTACTTIAACVDWIVLLLVPMLALERLLPRGRLAWRRRARAAGFTFGSGLVAAGVAGALQTTFHGWHLSIRAGQPFHWDPWPVIARAEELGRNVAAFGRAGGFVDLLVGAAERIHPEIWLLGILGSLVTLSPFRRCERARSVILPGLLASFAFVWADATALDASTLWMFTAPFLALGVGFLVSRTVHLAFRTPRTRLLTAAGTTALLCVLAIHAGELLHSARGTDANPEEVATKWRDVAPGHRLLLPRPREPHPAFEYYAERRLGSYDPRAPWNAIPLGALRQLDRAMDDVPLPPHFEPLAIALPTDVTSANGLSERLAEVIAFERTDVAPGESLLVVDGPSETEYQSLLALRRDPVATRDLRTALLERSAQAPRASILYTDPLPAFRGQGPLCADGVWFYFLDIGRYDELIGAIPSPEHSLDLEFRAMRGEGARAVVVTSHSANNMPGLRDYEGVRHRWEGQGSYWTAELPESALKAPLMGPH